MSPFAKKLSLSLAVIAVLFVGLLFRYDDFIHFFNEDQLVAIELTEPACSHLKAHCDQPVYFLNKDKCYIKSVKAIPASEEETQFNFAGNSERSATSCTIDDNILQGYLPIQERHINLNDKYFKTRIRGIMKHFNVATLDIAYQYPNERVWGRAFPVQSHFTILDRQSVKMRAQAKSFIKQLSTEELPKQAITIGSWPFLIEEKNEDDNTLLLKVYPDDVTLYLSVTYADGKGQVLSISNELVQTIVNLLFGGGEGRIPEFDAEGGLKSFWTESYND